MRTPIVLLMCLVLTCPAWAADDGETLEQAKDTIEEIAKARKTRDADLMGAAFVRVVELHNGLEGDKWRKKLQVAVGSVLKDKKCKDLHDEALSTLEQLDDGDGVYKQLGSLLPKANAKEPSPNAVYAVKVVGIVRSPKGLSYLGGLAEKAINLDVREAAVRALGKYRALEKGNVKALDRLLRVLLTARLKIDEEPTDAQRKAWARLEKPLVESLDELTYLDLGSSAKWVEWHGKNKSKLKKVFDS